MSPDQIFEQHSRRLVEPDLRMLFLCMDHYSTSCVISFLFDCDIQARVQMVKEVRDSLEIALTAEYLNFLKCYFPAFTVILLQLTKPQFVDNPEQLRYNVVDILSRLPQSEFLRPFVQDLLKPFLWEHANDWERCQADGDSTLRTRYKPATAAGLQLNPSTRSFKIVIECPLVVVVLFQFYSRLLQANIPQLLPLMVAAISVPGPERVPPHLETHFIELKGAQVKMKTVNEQTHPVFPLLKSITELLGQANNEVTEDNDFTHNSTAIVSPLSVPSLFLLSELD
ncbi:hypothetical protein VNO77_11761 [Canavalia gladiata]|uniref:Transformation/transcription domain associated protein n=1 Tax=Canavalia gladiata TaxID=3824 RepID=A0AAN9MCA0_CANGL